MRPGNNQQITDILSAAGITTAICARLEFKSETLGLWTGLHPIQPTGSGDSLLDGLTFEPMASGVMLAVGDNAFSYQGSEALTLTLAIPASPSVAIAAASVAADEYLARTAVLWRAILIQPNDPLAEPTWIFRRVRAGAMDKVEVSNDGQQATFTLTIESHASLITAATGSTYLDQDKFDPNDTSQRYAASIANGGLAPTYSSGGSSGQGYSDADNSASILSIYSSY